MSDNPLVGLDFVGDTRRDRPVPADLRAQSSRSSYPSLPEGREERVGPGVSSVIIHPLHFLDVRLPRSALENGGSSAELISFSRSISCFGGNRFRNRGVGEVKNVGPSAYHPGDAIAFQDLS